MQSSYLVRFLSATLKVACAKPIFGKILVSHFESGIFCRPLYFASIVFVCGGMIISVLTIIGCLLSLLIMQSYCDSFIITSNCCVCSCMNIVARLHQQRIYHSLFLLLTGARQSGLSLQYIGLWQFADFVRPALKRTHLW